MSISFTNSKNILGHSFFSHFNTADAFELASHAEFISKNKLDILFTEGEKADAVYLLLEGVVSISKRDSSGHSSVIAHIYAGDYFGEFALLDGGLRSATIQAVTPIQVAKIDRNHLMKQIKKDNISGELMKRVIGKIRDTNEKHADEQNRQQRLQIVNAITGNILENFRNPLTALYMFTEMVKKKSPELARYCEIAQAQVDRISGMADEILDYTTNTTVIQKNECDLAKLFERFEQLNQYFLSTRNIELRLNPISIVIQADDDKLLRAMQYITTYSVRSFSPIGGIIVISATQKNEQLIIQIKDNGSGFTSNKIKFLFTPGSQNEDPPFDGLDMAITKCIIEAHGGTINVESEPRVGTTYTIQIPKQ